jgi:uncharacterized RDD family membrane protein YckC
MLIDSVVVVLTLLVVVAAVSAVSKAAANPVGYVLEVLSIAYFIYCWSEKGLWPGQTLGMKALGVRVVRADGRPVSILTAIIRYVVLVVCFLIVGLGILWVAFDGKKQGWHDKVAGTVVIKG